MSALKNNPPIPLSQLAAEIIRLSSGQTCTFIMLAVWNHKESRFAVPYLAECCRCDVPTLKRNLNALVIRGLAEVVYLDSGAVAIEFRYKEWESLPDFRGAGEL